MTINHELRDKTLYVALAGELTYANADELGDFLQQQYDNIWALEIDMKDLAYTSSAGLRIILNAELVMKKRGGMILKNVNETIKAAFAVAGFDRFLKIQ